jgi:hypothetical protein
LDDETFKISKQHYDKKMNEGLEGTDRATLGSENLAAHLLPVIALAIAATLLRHGLLPEVLKPAPAPLKERLSTHLRRWLFNQ